MMMEILIFNSRGNKYIIVRRMPQSKYEYTKRTFVRYNFYSIYEARMKKVNLNKILLRVYERKMYKTKNTI